MILLPAPLLAQMLGGIFLVLFCATLYGYRRRAYLLYWALAWLYFGLWQLVGGSDPARAPPWAHPLAVICAGWHALFWVLGIRGFISGSGLRLHQELQLDSTLVKDAGLSLFPARTCVALLAMGALGLLAGKLLPPMVSRELIALAFAGVYSWSIALFLHAYRWQRRGGTLFAALVLTLITLEQIHHSVLWTLRAVSDSVPDYAFYLGFLDLLLQALAAVSLMVLFLDEEQSRLRDALERLAESQDHFRLIFQHSGVGMALLTPDGRFLRVNPGFEQLLGYDSKELSGRRLVELTHPQDASQLHSQSELGIEVPSSKYERERLFKHKGGRGVWLRVLRVPLRDANKKLSYIVGVFLDITEQRAAEQALREERDFITQVLETADALIEVLAPDGTIIRFNSKCATLSGYQEERMRGRVFWEVLVAPRNRQAARAIFERVVREQVPVGCEGVWITASGDERHISWRYSTVGGEPGGTPRFVIGAGLDITEQKQLGEQLRQAQKMETLGTLVGGIAHDFNNQLTAVLGNLELVLQQLTPGSPGQRELEDAEHAGERCAELTRRLLTFSRRRISQARPLNLNQLVGEVSRLLQRVLPGTVALDLKLEPELWLVNADQTQLHQVIMNLAVNARDAMSGKGTLTFRTGNQTVDARDCAHNLEWRPGRFVTLEVRDTGSGMTTEVQARIFEPFFTTKPIGEGTGLGLAMVFGIVKAHGGWITVVSQVGQGSVFQVYLPATEATAKVEPEPERPIIRGGHECVLVVDDEELVRNLVRAILNRWGFTVLTAADGLEALNLYRQKASEIDLVLLDYNMPQMTGLQVLQSLRAVNPQIPVIFSSGRWTPGDAQELLDAGARAFVAKPYHPEELVARIRQVLDEPAAPANGAVSPRASDAIGV
jgi:PAS domain S-box-containing protein